jgi:hypothetical protein
MSLFRSEDHVNRWLRNSGFARGAVVPLDTVLRLARAWYMDPRSPMWRARTRTESQAILTSLGLTDDFWQLP